MRNNLEKFVFLGVMIGVTFFLGQSRDSAAKKEQELSINPPVVLSFEESRPETEVAKDESVNTSLEQEDEGVDDLLLEPDSNLVFEDPEPKKNEELPRPKVEITSKPEVKPTSFKGVFVRVGESEPGDLQATVVLVSDLKAGEGYFEKEPLRRWPIASITKLMTAVVALEKMDKNLEITVTEKDFELLAEEGKVKAGERYTASDLIRVMLGASSNEAAEALANAYGRPGFISAMNDRAREWILSNTYFKDPTGISVSNQSTAKDLELLARNILRDYPEIFQMTRQPQVVVREITSGRSLKFLSNNLFAGKAYFLGGKTGYIEESEGNLLSVFSYGGRPVLIVVLGTPSRFEETEQLYDWFRANYRI